MSVRYVEAGSSEEAEAQVADSILGAIDLHSSAAHATIASEYEACGPIQRKNMLAALDGLTEPRTRTTTQRQLRRWQKVLDETETWAAEQVAKAPPPDPARVEKTLRMIELRRVEENMVRLQKWRSPRHSG